MLWDTRERQRDGQHKGLWTRPLLWKWDKSGWKDRKDHLGEIRRQRRKEFTGCLICTEMRADRRTGGSRYLSQNADTRGRTRVCVREENTGVGRLSTDTNKPSFLCQDRDVCPFPGLDHVRPTENFPSNQPLANQVTHTHTHKFMHMHMCMYEIHCPHIQFIQGVVTNWFANIMGHYWPYN